ncbi:sugar 3,4-ketoisomerase [Aeromonas schubertii]|uniref:sugar 3,4-ketoisomerase n=1 Tax=Aeromonas schubertii TaxID=652 RepID=UPI0010A875FA|nr:FdtA/QdtA family cupin domain-containing protein [Aeromonas schubertii]QCG48635.1 WxcM-like domain-containing protein [Aeromonas schubertii]
MWIERSPLQVKGDHRGALIALEEGINIPFSVKRVYYIYNTLKDVSRGFHAHKKLTQMIIAVRGSCLLVLDDGSERQKIVLNNPAEGILIGPMVWREMHEFTEDCVLMVLADQLYNESDYIRNYNDFLYESNT